MPADVLVMVAAAAAGVVAAVVALTSADARVGLAMAIGVTGGLQTFQIARVHVFSGVVLLWLVLGPLRDRNGPVRLDVRLLPPVCTGVLVLTVFTGSMVNSPTVAIQLMLLATSAAVFAVFADGMDLRAVWHGLLLVTSYGSLVGLLQYAGFLPHELFVGENRPIGIYEEPDWLGMFSAIGLLLSFYVRRKGLRYTAAAVNLAAVLLAAARAPWLALVVVGVVGVLLARFAPVTERPRGAWRLTGFAVISGGVLLVAVPDLAAFLVTRVGGASTRNPDVSAMARQQQVESLRHLESIAPWNGLGISASGRVGVSGRITYTGQADNNVASNWILGWWVDGKLLAVPLIALFVCAALVRANRISGRVLLLVLVSSLFSNAMYIPIAWLALGACLVSDRVRLNGRDQGGRTGRGRPAAGRERDDGRDSRDASSRGALVEERS